MNYSIRYQKKYENTRKVRPGEIVITMDKEQIFLVALEEDEEEFPYVLINLSNARLVQNYEDIPTIEQIESWIGEIKIVAPSNKLTLHLNLS